MISIGFTGVDGTGKSTIVKNVMALFPENKAVVQYMGLKAWETQSAKKCYDYEHPYALRHLQKLILLNELRHRVYKHKKEEQVVIFDRYVDEQYLQFKKYQGGRFTKYAEKLYKLYLVDHFYHPTVFFYLTCSVEASIDRKEDITSESDIKRLIVNKKIMDEYYRNKENTIVIDTSQKTIDETMEIIKAELRRHKCFSILMN